MQKSIFNIIIIAAFAVVVSATAVSMTSAWGGGDTDTGSGSVGDCCGGGDHTPTPTPTPTPDPVPPVCNYLRTSVASLPVGGGNVTLTWSSSRGTSATLTPDGSAVALNSSKTVNVTDDTTFVFRVVNSDGSHTCQVRVEVEDQAAPTCDLFTASPTNLPYGGGNVTLKWETTNATSVSISGIGSVAADNTTGLVRQVTQTTTFVLTATNVAGNDTCQATVTVAPQTPVASCDLFTASPTNLPYGGGNVTLKWETTNATSVSISGIGSVADDNTTGLVRSINQTTTFVLTATNAHGSDDCQVRITVGEPATLSCADNVRFTANDYSLPYGGGNVTLSWDTNGLDAIAITDVSNPAFDGSATVNVNDDKTYTLTATKDGRSVSCPLTIDVASKGGGGGGSSSPKCTLKVSDDEIKRGQEITLSWTTSKLDEVVIKDNHGNVLVDGDDKDDLDGSMKIRPTKDTTFTLVGEKGSRSKTCKVEVEVEEGVSITETRNQLPLVAGISLTQVPYTGFEAGPMLTTIFYALLTIWGLFVAYIVAVRRDMIGGVSLAGAHDHVAYTDASSDVQTEVSPAAQYVAAVTTPDVPANLPTGIAPVVGYAAIVETTMTEVEADASIEMTELENRAHALKALFSSDAMRYFTKVTAADERFAALDQLIAKAKAAFPSEDGWLVVNLARLESLLETNTAAATVAAEVTAGNGGSLAEAIVTGNIVAAYQLIAHRPMIALADAAAELDAVVRARRGEVVSLSTMLADESARLTDTQLADAIKALTSAIDGVYTSEEEAVKMAIMKAVKATV